jgi:hypothetical protein
MPSNPLGGQFFLKALEVVHQAVAEKKVILVDDMQSNYITSRCNKKEPNQYWIIVHTSCQGYFRLLLMVMFS